MSKTLGQGNFRHHYCEYCDFCHSGKNIGFCYGLYVKGPVTWNGHIFPRLSVDGQAWPNDTSEENAFFINTFCASGICGKDMKKGCGTLMYCIERLLDQLSGPSMHAKKAPVDDFIDDYGDRVQAAAMAALQLNDIQDAEFEPIDDDIICLEDLEPEVSVLYGGSKEWCSKVKNALE